VTDISHHILLGLARCNTVARAEKEWRQNVSPTIHKGLAKVYNLSHYSDGKSTQAGQI
jgi:hypothetical protein